MLGWRRQRFLAVITGLVVSFGTPGQALSHGYAHHESHEHAAASVDADLHAAVDGDLQVERNDSNGSSDHPHPELAGCVCGRLHPIALGVPAASPSVSLAIALQDATSEFGDVDERPPPRPDVAPLNSRAPPSLT
jgi:hypothetical protein